MEEVWKSIEGCVGYEVSSHGRVRNAIRRNELKTQLNHNGYVIVSMMINRKSKTYCVHRIVAKPFVDNPDNKPCVDQINRIRTDNSVTNLRWATVAKNCQNRSLCINNKLKEQYITKYTPSWQRHSTWYRFTRVINGVRYEKVCNTLE